MRLYVVGDIHGRIDLVRKLEAVVLEDLEPDRERISAFVVYLGDYVDRGFESAAVIEHLSRSRMPGCRRVFVAGNHDIWLKDCALGREVPLAWLVHGGDATLLSYGVRPNLSLPERDRLIEAQGRLREVIPAHHLAFLQGLERGFSFGDYFFCHAGIRPGVPLENQTTTDLTWIREPFLSHGRELPKVVVHGHTVSDDPVVRINRIGIDTGACWTGKLTCLVLEGCQQRFFSTPRLG